LQVERKRFRNKRRNYRRETSGPGIAGERAIWQGGGTASKGNLQKRGETSDRAVPSASLAGVSQKEESGPVDAWTNGARQQWKKKKSLPRISSKAPARLRVANFWGIASGGLCDPVGAGRLKADAKEVLLLSKLDSIKFGEESKGRSKFRGQMHPADRGFAVDKDQRKNPSRGGKIAGEKECWRGCPCEKGPRRGEVNAEWRIRQGGG